MSTDSDVTAEPAELRAALEHLGERERDALHGLPGPRSALEHLGDRERETLHQIRASVVDLRDDELVAPAP